MPGWFTRLQVPVQVAIAGGVIAAIGAIIVTLITTFGGGGGGPIIIIVPADSVVVDELTTAAIEGPAGSVCTVNSTNPDGQEEELVESAQIPEGGILTFPYRPEGTGDHELEASCVVDEESVPVFTSETLKVEPAAQVTPLTESKFDINLPGDRPKAGERTILQLDGLPLAVCSVTVTGPGGQEEELVGSLEIPEGGSLTFGFTPEEAGMHEFDAACVADGELFADSESVDVTRQAGQLTPPQDLPAQQ